VLKDVGKVGKAVVKGAVSVGKKFGGFAKDIYKGVKTVTGKIVKSVGGAIGKAAKIFTGVVKIVKNAAGNFVASVIPTRINPSLGSSGLTQVSKLITTNSQLPLNKIIKITSLPPGIYYNTFYINTNNFLESLDPGNDLNKFIAKHKAILLRDYRNEQLSVQQCQCKDVVSYIGKNKQYMDLGVQFIAEMSRICKLQNCKFNENINSLQQINSGSKFSFFDEKEEARLKKEKQAKYSEETIEESSSNNTKKGSKKNDGITIVINNNN